MKTTHVPNSLPAFSDANRRMIAAEGRTKLQAEIRAHPFGYQSMPDGVHATIDPALAEAQEWKVKRSDCYEAAMGDDLVCRTGIGMDTVVAIHHGMDPLHTIVPGDIEVLDLSNLG